MIMMDVPPKDTSALNTPLKKIGINATNEETGITLRSIGIDSHDGLFSGTLTIMVSDTGHLEALVKKLRTVKGVKQVSRN